METVRFTTKPIDRRITIELPAGMNSETVEVIVRGIKKSPPGKNGYRKPPAALKRTVIHDSLIAPAVPENEWDTLQ